MMYYKPKGVRYVDMCIWIDENAHKEDCDDEKLFEYLFLIIVMLVKQNRDFRTEQEYNDFGVFGASHMYFKYLTKRKKIKDQDDIEEEPYKYRVKSCLNYIKSILPYIRIQFQQEVFENYKTRSEREDEIQDNYVFSEQLSEIVDEIALSDFRMYLDDVPKTIRKFLQQIPIKKNSFEWDNIYVSVILTIIAQMTVTRKIKDIVFKMQDGRKRSDSYMESLYEAMRNRPVILYRLDDSMRGYIRVLAREAKHLIAEDLSEMSNVYIPADEGMAKEIISQLTGEYEDGDYDA